MRKKLLILFCFSFCVSIVEAQSIEAQDSTMREVVYPSDSLTEQASPLLLTADTSTALQTIPLTSSIEQPVDTAVAEVPESNPIKLSGFFAPATLMIYGLTIQGHNGLYPSYNVHRDMQHMFPDFHTPVDDYVQFIPAVAAYATGFFPGAKPRHSNGRRLWMFVQAQLLTSVAVAALKYYSHEQRPNGSDYLSFPSGHTAQAFMGAALFDMEYPEQMKGIKIGLYTLAGLTGMLAMMNDRHWANDVLFGAGVGMLSVRLLYLTEERFKKKQNRR
ncbi:MAG: hypothetical protein JWO58_2482 [Chitinophagaceae bacterium]|nr:hypothetical protein [Chitinophagaceae bacterium]